MLPTDGPAWAHVWYNDRTWHHDATWAHSTMLRRQDVCTKAGRDHEPCGGMIDHQHVATTAMGGVFSGIVGGT
jgi:hypothetical protein